MKKYNLGGWNFTISIADGIYNVSSSIIVPQPNGSGGVNLIGNVTNPQAVQIQSNAGSVVRIFQRGVFTFQGLTFLGNGTPVPGDNGDCLDVAIGTVNVTDCRYGDVQNFHLAAQTPFTAQREKRLWVLHQPPKCGGKSRHGTPTRNFQITASTKRRLPRSLLRPTVPGRPGSKCSIRANWSSRNA